MFDKTVRYVVWNGGKWYFKRHYSGTAKVFGALAAVTVLSTVAYVIASGNDRGASVDSIE